MKLRTGLVTRAKRLRGSTLKRYRALALRARGQLYLQRLEKSVDILSTPPNALFKGVDDELWLWLNTEGYRKSSLLRALLPLLPDEKVQVALTGAVGDATLGPGHLVYTWVKQIFAEHVGSISSAGNILDFGCGWGRVIRFFLKDVAPAKLWGADPVRQFIEICRQTNPWCHFQRTDPWPPSTFDDGMFDLIFCNSVFSHFSEEIHEKWLAEFRRILRPGGLLIATTWPRDYIERHEQVIRTYPEWMRPSAFADKQKHFADYDSGKYCYSRFLGLEESILGPYWGETCISQQYVMSRWTRDFEVLEYIADATKYPQRRSYLQNVIVARKAAAAGIPVPAGVAPNTEV